MTLDEMRKYEWQVSWSGGKDSTATILLMRENNIPIKRIVYVRMMWDDNIPATLPIMTNFVDKTIELFKQWGLNVIVEYPKYTAVECMERVYKKSINPELLGKPYGIYAISRQYCMLMREKTNAISRISKNVQYDMIGYAINEKERIKRLGGGKQSILATLGITEDECFKICRKYKLLSPLYDLGVERDGCFFCPNISMKEVRMLEKTRPDLVKILYSIFGQYYDVYPYSLSLNRWYEYWLKNKGTKNKLINLTKNK